MGLLIAMPPRPLRAEDANVWFNKAVQYDLNGTGDTTLAFAWYRRAAEAGMPEAEFNVAVMLDSGRGVRPDLAEAAVWYAKAATHGNHRAAYNLGLLYEDGQGVPQNLDLAHAYFADSNLAAAHGHLMTQRPRSPNDASLSAPTLLAPGRQREHRFHDERRRVRLDVVSCSPSRCDISSNFAPSMRPDPTRFSPAPPTLASVFAALPALRGDYAWRVTAIGRKAGRYAASAWTRFNIAPSQSAAE